MRSRAARNVAETTPVAMMGRISPYTGKLVRWSGLTENDNSSWYNLNRSNRSQTRLDKTLALPSKRLSVISIHLIGTTAISLPTLFRGKEIACSETKKLRCCSGAHQTPRQIMTIWHVVCLIKSGVLCYDLPKRTLHYDHLAHNMPVYSLGSVVSLFLSRVPSSWPK